MPHYLRINGEKYAEKSDGTYVRAYILEQFISSPSRNHQIAVIIFRIKTTTTITEKKEFLTAPFFFLFASQHLLLSREVGMLWTLFVILLILWLLGLVTSYTLGGFIHILLVVALVVVIIQIIQGRRVV